MAEQIMAQPSEQVVVEETKETKVPDVTPTGDLVAKLQVRINDQSRLIAGLQKEITAMKKEPAAAPEKVIPGSEALQQLEQKAMAREERANQKSIRSSVLSAMVESGLTEVAAKKLLPSMLAEAQFEVTEDDEVLAQEGESKRPARDFVKGTLLRDDWKALVPQKRGPEKASGRPVATPAPLSPNENGVYSAKAARAASAGG